MVSSHSRSTRPMTPILIPFEDVSMTVFLAFPSGISSPKAGSIRYESRASSRRVPYTYDVCKKPRECALVCKIPELSDPEVKIVILKGKEINGVSEHSAGITYPNTCHIGPNTV